MKDKISILHERALITCVVMLFICIIFKLFGVQWFNLDTNISVLQEIDKIMSESFVLSSIYSFVMYSINMSFYIFMSCQDRKHGFDTLVKTLIFIPVIIFIKIYFDNQVIAFLIESLILFLVVFLSSKYKFKDSLKNFIICHLLTLIYQLISLFIRSLNIQIGYYGFITTVLLNLDYYILLLITYLYKERRIKND